MGYPILVLAEGRDGNRVGVGQGYPVLVLAWGGAGMGWGQGGGTLSCS